MRTLDNYIAGEPAAPAGGDYLDDLEPATGAPLARVPASGSADVERAVAAAGAAFPRWAGTPAARPPGW